jgi:alkanesulfonate monooxygenase SsuD/methylene tetrahydromethanopterin reductase-like flavin-dependent oxidoreductase (luciferase family)
MTIDDRGEVVMVKLSISVEGLFGLTWTAWKRMVCRAEELGFHGLYLSDHFNMPSPPDYPSLELVPALTWLADHTERVRFGPMVSPLSFRDPVMLARQAAALDDLSDGRVILGLGTGHFEREHAMFGYPLGDMPTRFARLQEGLEVITRLLGCTGPVSFDGQFFQLRDAVLPQPRRPGGPPIMVGGGGPKRTLPVVARYADVWNAHRVTPEQMQERSALLDEMLEREGRRPHDVHRSLTLPVLCWRTEQELEERYRGYVRYPAWRGWPAQQIATHLRTGGTSLVGSPQEVVEQIQAFAAAGTQEMVMQWTLPDDLDGLKVLAKEVLPLVA